MWFLVKKSGLAAKARHGQARGAIAALHRTEPHRTETAGWPARAILPDRVRYCRGLDNARLAPNWRGISFFVSDLEPP